MVAKAKRMQNLAPYLFAQLEAKIATAREQGVNVINLGIGDPDQPTPPDIVEELVYQASQAANHQYPTSKGMLELRQAVTDWYAQRLGVSLNPENEAAVLIGSKEGIAHLPFCFLDPGDTALVPDPGYPVYQGGVTLAGGTPYLVPLREENGFLPDLGAIPDKVAARAKLMFLNYPNNPTGAVATNAFFADVVSFAKEHDILVAHDAAYVEIGYEDYEPVSFLQAPGASDVGVEFGSPSKSHNMTGWRVGWVAGSAAVVEALTTLKSNIDSGAFQAVQHACRRALEGSRDSVQEQVAVYHRRRDLVVSTLRDMGWTIDPPQATIYVWARTPQGTSSIEFAEQVFLRTGVVITPGVGYGNQGEGYFRISLTVDDAELQQAMRRLAESGITSL